MRTADRERAHELIPSRAQGHASAVSLLCLGSCELALARRSKFNYVVTCDYRGECRKCRFFLYFERIM